MCALLLSCHFPTSPPHTHHTGTMATNNSPSVTPSQTPLPHTTPALINEEELNLEENYEEAGMNVILCFTIFFGAAIPLFILLGYLTIPPLWILLWRYLDSLPDPLKDILWKVLDPLVLELISELCPKVLRWLMDWAGYGSDEE